MRSLVCLLVSALLFHHTAGATPDDLPRVAPDAAAKPESKSRSLSDLVTEELVAALSKKENYEFKSLFAGIYENLKRRSDVSASEDMVRLLAYEKLQDLVSREMVEKHGAQYRGLEKLKEARNPPDSTITLWEKGAPRGDGTTTQDQVICRVFRAPKPNGAAVVICPGGGYGGLVTGGEGTGIAAWLNKHGIAGIVLEYRLPAQKHSMVPLLDAQRAIRTVRARAAEWGLDTKRIGIMGFSAGGHLASTAATHFDAGKPDATDAVEKQSSRPDFAILVYPVISMGELGHTGSRQNLLGPGPTPEMIKFFSGELQVTTKTCPVYLAHAKDDRVVSIENSRVFHAALQKAGVTSRLLELASGDHGLNGYQGPMWDAWQAGSLQWLAELKFIPDADAR